MKAIEVKHLSFCYDEKTSILNDVNFTLNQGETLTIVGKNGSGKSTLAKILVGLLPFKNGQIKIFENEIDPKKDIAATYHLAIVFQNPDNQFIASSVEDDIAFGLENYCVDPARMHDLVIKYAKMVGMENYLEFAPENLSGGQKQRVAIAGVLALNANIIIFDEATSMLDPEGKKDFHQTLNALKKENPLLTIIMITHDKEEIINSDKILVLDKGEVVLFIKTNELNKYREQFLNLGLDLPFNYSLISELNKNGFTIDFSDDYHEIIKQL